MLKLLNALSFLGSFFSWIKNYLFYRAGKKSVIAELNKKEAKLKDEFIKEEHNRPVNRDDVIKRLRDGSF